MRIALLNGSYVTYSKNSKKKRQIRDVPYQTKPQGIAWMESRKNRITSSDAASGTTKAAVLHEENQPQTAKEEPIAPSLFFHNMSLDLGLVSWGLDGSAMASPLKPVGPYRVPLSTLSLISIIPLSNPIASSSAD